MGLSVVTAASTRRLTSIDAITLDIGPDGLGADLPVVEALIDAASGAAERWCGYIFAQQKYVETLQAQRAPVLILRQRPIVVVHEVKVGESVITDYQIQDAEAGLLRRRAGWYTWAEWPHVTVTYTAGYQLPDQTAPVDATGPTLPSDLERAVIEMIKVWHHERLPSDRIASKTFGLTGDRVDFGVSAHRTALPVLAQRLLDPYRMAVMR